ncbi:tyrosine-type recombinase/integrase, partial [Paracoccus sp. MBLB3053]
MKTFRDLVTALERRRAKLAPISPATRYRTAAVLREIGSLSLTADVDDYLDWIARLQAKSAAPATVSGRIVTALGIAREARAVLRDKIPPHQVPVEQLEIVRDFARRHHVSGPSQPRHRAATPSEIHTLIRAAQERRGEIRMELIIPFAIATALRRSEICRITWADFDPVTSTLLVRRRKHPKNPTDQRVPLSPAALAILRELGPGHPASRIFPY